MLRYVEFLMFLLRTQAQTLQRLAAFFGEEELIVILELAGEALEENGNPNPPSPPPAKWFLEPLAGPSGSAYAELEIAVKEIKLHSMLEFHLWTYPYYRTLIESPIPLHSLINIDDAEALELLIAQAIAQSKAWVKTLPVPPAQALQVEQVAAVPWLRFRAELMIHAGKKPFGLAQAPHSP